MRRGLLTTAEVARRFDKSVRTIHRLAASGMLPYEQKLPGRTGSYLFNVAAVEAALRETEEKAS